MSVDRNLPFQKPCPEILDHGRRPVVSLARKEKWWHTVILSLATRLCQIMICGYVQTCSPPPPHPLSLLELVPTSEICNIL